MMRCAQIVTEAAKQNLYSKLSLSHKVITMQILWPSSLLWKVYDSVVKVLQRPNHLVKVLQRPNHFVKVLQRRNHHAHFMAFIVVIMKGCMIQLSPRCYKGLITSLVNWKEQTYNFVHCDRPSENWGVFHKDVRMLSSYIPFSRTNASRDTWCNEVQCKATLVHCN